MSSLDRFGPIEYVAVQFADGTVPVGGFDALLRLVDQGTVRVLDLEFVAKSGQGDITVVPASQIDGVDGDFVGAASGLLDWRDVELIGASMSAGALSAVLVYEERAMIEVVDAWTAGGGHTLLEGHLSLDELVTALDDTEAVA